MRRIENKLKTTGLMQELMKRIGALEVIMRSLIALNRVKCSCVAKMTPKYVSVCIIFYLNLCLKYF